MKAKRELSEKIKLGSVKGRGNTPGDRVYFELPCLEALHKKEKYSWHFQVVVELKFDKSETQKLKTELDLQVQIGEEILRILNREAIKFIKLGAHIKNGVLVHDFYIDKLIRRPSAKTINVVMGIMEHRGMSFELHIDREWMKAKPYFKILGYDSLEALHKKLLDLR